jgi:polysaccharide pyruvyl transferase WcaK-like protein
MTTLRALMKEPSRILRRVRSKLRGVRQRRSPGRENEAFSGASDRFVETIGPTAPTKPPGPTVVLLNDCRDQVNFGARALVDGLMAILSESAPNATILPIPSHWLIDWSHGSSGLVNDGDGLRQPQARFPTVADQFEAIADEWMQGRGGRGAHQFLNRFEAADLVVLNGEGSIYRTNLSAIRELFLAWLARERLGISTVYVNGGLHLSDVMPVLPAMVRKTFRTLDAIAIRDPWSLRNLQEYVPGVDAQLVPDSAFVITASEARDTGVVRRIREQVGDAPYFCFDPGTMPMDHRSPDSSTLHAMISILKRVTPRAVFVSSSPADRYIEPVAAQTGALFVDSVADYREYMTLVADAQFIVSGRYHNAILAAIMGCPSITFASTSHKVHGACELLENLVGMPYDGTDLRPRLDEIEHQARAYVENRDDLRERLQAVCGRRRSEAFQLGELVNGVLRSRA